MPISRRYSIRYTPTSLYYSVSVDTESQCSTEVDTVMDGGAVKAAGGGAGVGQAGFSLSTYIPSPCDPRRWMHRYLMLLLMCMLSFGSYYVYDNPAALQRIILQVHPGARVCVHRLFVTCMYKLHDLNIHFQFGISLFVSVFVWGGGGGAARVCWFVGSGSTHWLGLVASSRLCTVFPNTDDGTGR